ncbi:hypothetical protein CEXT_583581 [Caerostris extrusa]|uniref:Uncharacterized protein n=1 Tax=Caerostris extrusa TaxID=172846 RepID=A0AAV4X8V8_CAEEX|nr:hypothetical protein CEXT_583581 [Caerostris extrusa]
MPHTCSIKFELGDRDDHCTRRSFWFYALADIANHLNSDINILKNRTSIHGCKKSANRTNMTSPHCTAITVHVGKYVDRCCCHINTEP